MFPHPITDADIEYRQKQVSSDYSSSQRVVSIKGLREIVGSTLIQFGTHLHGKATDICQEAEARRESGRILQGTEALVK